MAIRIISQYFSQQSRSTIHCACHWPAGFSEGSRRDLRPGGWSESQAGTFCPSVGPQASQWAILNPGCPNCSFPRMVFSFWLFCPGLGWEEGGSSEDICLSLSYRIRLWNECLPPAKYLRQIRMWEWREWSRGSVDLFIPLSVNFLNLGPWEHPESEVVMLRPKTWDGFMGLHRSGHRSL